MEGKILTYSLRPSSFEPIENQVLTHYRDRVTNTFLEFEPHVKYYFYTFIGHIGSTKLTTWHQPFVNFQFAPRIPDMAIAGFLTYVTAQNYFNVYKIFTIFINPVAYNHPIYENTRMDVDMYVQFYTADTGDTEIGPRLHFGLSGSSLLNTLNEPLLQTMFYAYSYNNWMAYTLEFRKYREPLLIHSWTSPTRFSVPAEAALTNTPITLYNSGPTV